MLVAVYGSLKKGRGNNSLLRDSRFVGKSRTDEEYTMYSLGAFPAVCLNGSTSVAVEVYEINQRTFERLDRLEGYPSFYNRLVVDTEYGPAWMYYIEQEDELRRRCKVVPQGEW